MTSLYDEPRYNSAPEIPLVFLAACEGHIRIAQILLEHGAHPDAHAICDMMPLMAAANGTNVELARLVLQKGASINARDCEGQSALGLSAERREPKVMEILLAYGQTRPGPSQSIRVRIDPDKQFSQKHLFEALKFGIKGQHIEIVRILLDKGVLSRARNKGLHHELLDLAVKVENKTIIDMFERGMMMNMSMRMPARMISSIFLIDHLLSSGYGFAEGLRGT